VEPVLALRGAGSGFRRDSTKVAQRFSAKPTSREQSGVSVVALRGVPVEVPEVPDIT
jgi:hypothetical protein